MNPAMKSIASNSKIQVFSATFNGVHDIIEHGLKDFPKEGVYVGVDHERYPCFDEEDYAYEKRFYWNFVFAESREEMERKLQQLRLMKPMGRNYRKLCQELHPMAYWEGDMQHPVKLL